MSSAAPWTDAKSDKLSLNSIRSTLIRQEDTIIFALIERAQFSHNPACYDAGDLQYAALRSGSSLLDFMLLETERLHAAVRRYTSPDEHPFFPHRLPAPVLPLIEFPQVLHPTMSNLNGDIKDLYLQKLLPELCSAGDDGNHGSCVVADIAVLQAMSKRVHYGFFVAESKFLAQTAEFTKLIEARDEDGIMALLTHAAVEEKVLRRVRAKAATFGLEIEAPDGANPGASTVPAAASKVPRVDPELIVRLYRDHVIPLTKVAEVQYLLQRLSSPAVAHHGAPGSAVARAARQYAVNTSPVGKVPPALLELPTAADVFEAIMSGKAHHGVCLLEQGDSGILSGIRTLLKDNPLRVVGELTHETKFKLLSRCSSLQGVRKVVGRSDVLRMSREWLRSISTVRSVDVEEVVCEPGELPTALAQPALAGAADAGIAYLVETYVDAGGAGAEGDEAAAATSKDNGGGGKRRRGDSAAAATAATAAAPVVELARAPDDVVEHARCVILARADKCNLSAPSGHDKTMLYFTLDREEAGSLQAALECLHRHSVNLLSIRSYASGPRSLPGRVDFIATCEGHETEKALSGAMGELKTKATLVRVLGSFAVPQGPMVMVSDK